MIDILAIVAIHAGIAVFWYLIRRLRSGINRRAFIGYYLVLMPIGIAAWDEPLHWFSAGLVVAGLVTMTVAMTPARS